eukprot:3941306-Rhodomonas_salina.4
MLYLHYRPPRSLYTEAGHCPTVSHYVLRARNTPPSTQCHCVSLPSYALAVPHRPVLTKDPQTPAHRLAVRR